MTETTILTPEHTTEPESLATLAARKHEAFAAKINGPMFGGRKHELQADYDLAEKTYFDALRSELGAEYQLEDGELSVDQQIEAFHEQFNERVAADRDAQKAELIAQGGKRAEFLSWYTNLSPAKKIGVTAGFAAGGAAAGFLATGLGAGTAVVVAGLGAYRFSRGYAMRVSKIYRDTEQPQYEVGEPTNTSDMIEQALAFMSRENRETIARAETIKKRAVLSAVGAVALGSAVGWGVRETLSDTGAGQAVANKVSSWREAFAGIHILPQAEAREIDYKLLSVEPAPIEINDNLSGRNADLYSANPAALDVETAETVMVDAQRESLGGTFTVEKGHGYTHELMESVESVYGVKLTPDQAWELHQELVRTSGEDYINLLDHKGADTYDMGGSKYNVGLSAGGEAEWDAEALDHIDDKFGSDVSTETTTTTDAETDAATDTAETPTVPEANERPGVSGTGGVDFEPPTPAETPAPTNTDQLTGMTEAESDHAAGSVSWEDMKQDAQEMRGMLLGGDIDSINMDTKFQDTLDYIQNDIGGMTYENSDIKIIEQVGTGFDARWQINESPNGAEMPGRVIELFDAYVKSLNVLAP